MSGTNGTGLRAHEQMRIGGLGTRRGNVVQDRVTDVLRQWQAIRPTRLALDRQVARAPVDIVEVHIPNITGTQAKPGEQENDGLVPNFHRAISRTCADDLLDRCRVDVPGQRRKTVALH